MAKHNPQPNADFLSELIRRTNVNSSDTKKLKSLRRPTPWIKPDFTLNDNFADAFDNFPEFGTYQYRFSEIDGVLGLQHRGFIQAQNFASEDQTVYIIPFVPNNARIETFYRDIIDSQGNRVAARWQVTTDPTGTSAFVSAKWPIVSAMYEIKIVSDLLNFNGEYFSFTIPQELNRKFLLDAQAYITTPSAVDVEVGIRNITQTAEMLSTNITINAGSYTSYDSSPQRVISAGGVFAKDIIKVYSNSDGGDAMGLGAILKF